MSPRLHPACSPAHRSPRRPTAREWSLLLERPRLVPPTLDRQVARPLDPKLPCPAAEAFAELVEVQREDVPEPFDARLDHQLVLARPEARQIEHQGFVAPGQDVRR